MPEIDNSKGYFFLLVKFQGERRKKTLEKAIPELKEHREEIKYNRQESIQYMCSITYLTEKQSWSENQWVTK